MNRAAGLIAAAAVTAAVAIGGCTSGYSPGGDKPGTTKPAAPSSNAPVAPRYDTIGAVTSKLQAAGLTTTTPGKSTDDTYITEVGGTDYELTISEKAGQQIGGSGIYLFPNDKALSAWTAVSLGMGGIAVVGDTWAISLPSGSEDRAITNRMAPEIAKALGGKVAR